MSRQECNRHRQRRANHQLHGALHDCGLQRGRGEVPRTILPSENEPISRRVAAVRLSSLTMISAAPPSCTRHLASDSGRSQVGIMTEITIFYQVLIRGSNLDPLLTVIEKA